MLAGSGLDFVIVARFLRSGPLAQSVEQRTFNPWVLGSIPSGPTLFRAVTIPILDESALENFCKIPIGLRLFTLYSYA